MKENNLITMNMNKNKKEDNFGNKKINKTNNNLVWMMKMKQNFPNYKMINGKLKSKIKLEIIFLIYLLHIGKKQ